MTLRVRPGPGCYSGGLKKGRNKDIGNAVIPIGGCYTFQGRLAEVEDVSRPKAARNGWGHFRMLRVRLGDSTIDIPDTKFAEVREGGAVSDGRAGPQHQ